MSQILNPAKLLTDLSGSNINGKLQVKSDRVTWNIYITNGQIECAGNSTQQSIKILDYHLRCLGLQDAAAAVKSIPISNSQGNSSSSSWLEEGKIIPSVNWLVLREHLDHSQVYNICTSLSQEAIETLLWIREGEYQWIKNAELPQHVLAARIKFQTIELTSLIQNIEKNIKTWQSFQPEISSPYQCPHLKNPQQSIAVATPILSKLAKFLRGLSFRQLALILNQDELKIAKLLHPSIKSGEVVILPPQAPFDVLPPIPGDNSNSGTASDLAGEHKLKVACIDDSPTILDEMQRFLASEAYELTKIDDPLKAAPILLRLKPDLILMDISMPNINGYKLCSFFRGSPSLKQVPIIMVSGRTGFIDKTRAKMVGATDYLTKPFSKDELLSVVHKYLSPNQVQA